jgi:hypothetical protein
MSYSFYGSLYSIARGGASCLYHIPNSVYGKARGSASV